ncbi:maleylpyruvate isomerase N-terminal domain-containing protein [Actinophytocola sp.]|uniref:maleylpyruvate isomerase N-terminal domain-containing protein n=1 Tax=Actinophytocola sp. TaxID=1872138 RepID=UPI003D6B08E8
MDESRFHECLEADYRRLREVAAGALGETVPSCPGWTGADLANHVAEVYLHKTEIMRHGAEPHPWPPDLGGDPLAALDNAYRELISEFGAHKPDEPTPSWYEGTQTVGWWLRRMAQETVIHRVDAELAAGAELTPIPADLAADGIDEVLVCFLAYGTTAYPEYVADHIAACDGDTVRIDVPEASWLVQLGPDVVTVEPVDAGAGADTDAVLRGSADAVLRWLWRRAGNDAVEPDGNRAAVGKLHNLLGVVEQ